MRLVEIASDLGSRLAIPVELICCGTGRDSFEAMAANPADACFLAVDAPREEAVAFTAPYAVIERSGVRVGVKKGSAHDLFLTRTGRQHAFPERDAGCPSRHMGLAAGRSSGNAREPLRRVSERLSLKR